MKYKYLFGPVPSRRLGISLGVDLVPHKVCSMNCVYCEVGRTTNLTNERAEYIPLKELMKEMKEYLKDEPNLDYITFSGAGEPLLNSGIGAIISFIKKNYPQYKLALITNSTQLISPEVRNEIQAIDLILPSLDSAIQSTFQKINRGSAEIDVNEIIAGIEAFQKESDCEMWLEILLVPGMNDTEIELAALKKAILKIKPEQVQLNTLDRPGTEADLVPLSEEKMKEVAAFLEPLPVHIIAKFKARKKISSFQKDIESTILETIKRRPCTAKDLSEILNTHINEINKYITTLLEDGKIIPETQERGTFFRAR